MSISIHFTGEDDAVEIECEHFNERMGTNDHEFYLVRISSTNLFGSGEVYEKQRVSIYLSPDATEKLYNALDSPRVVISSDEDVE